MLQSVSVPFWTRAWGRKGHRRCDQYRCPFGPVVGGRKGHRRCDRRAPPKSLDNNKWPSLQNPTRMVYVVGKISRMTVRQNQCPEILPYPPRSGPRSPNILALPQVYFAFKLSGGPFARMLLNDAFSFKLFLRFGFYSLTKRSLKRSYSIYKGGALSGAHIGSPRFWLHPFWSSLIKLPPISLGSPSQFTFKMSFWNCLSKLPFEIAFQITFGSPSQNTFKICFWTCLSKLPFRITSKTASVPPAKLPLNLPFKLPLTLPFELPF